MIFCVRDGEEDYRVRMIKRQLEEQKQVQVALLEGLERAERLADERAEHRAAMGSGTGVEADVDRSTMAKFDNPVADGGDSDDEESAKGKKGSKGKD